MRTIDLKSIIQVLLGIVFIFLLSSCMGPKKIINTTPYELDCPQVINFGPSGIDPIDSESIDSILSSNYSYNSLIVANAYGLINHLTNLEKLKELEQHSTAGDSIKLAILLKEKEIDRILDLAVLELESYENFINCNILNLLRIKSNLTSENIRSRNTYTNAAVIVGLVAAAVVGGIIVSNDEDLKNGDAIDWIGIGGAVAAASLAISSERVDKRVVLKLQKNLINPIWTGNQVQSIFSDRYWYLLNHDHFYDSTTLTVREYIVNIWQQPNGLLSTEKNNSYMPTLLAPEGEYTEEMLLLRIDMLEEIKTGIV